MINIVMNYIYIFLILCYFVGNCGWGECRSICYIILYDDGWFKMFILMSNCFVFFGC